MSNTKSEVTEEDLILIRGEATELLPHYDEASNTGKLARAMICLLDDHARLKGLAEELHQVINDSYRCLPPGTYKLISSALERAGQKF